MILLLAVIVPVILAVVLVDAALAQRQREQALSARIAGLRGRARRPVVHVSPPANDAVPLIAARLRGTRTLALRR